MNRLVTLDQVQLTKVKFPVAHYQEAELTALLQKKFPGATNAISLDRLDAKLDPSSRLGTIDHQITRTRLFHHRRILDVGLT